MTSATIGADLADALSAGDKLTFTVELTDGSKFSFDVETKAGTDPALELYYKDEKMTAGVVDKAKMTKEEIGNAISELLGGVDAITEKYDVDGTDDVVQLTSQEAAFGDAGIKVISVAVNGANKVNVAGSITTEGEGGFTKFDVAQAQAYDASSTTMKAEDSIFEVNGQKFAFAKDADSTKALGSDVNVVIISTGTAPTAPDATSMVNLMNQKLGTNFEAPASGITIDMIYKGGIDSTAGGGSGSGKGLKLQVGDTADEYNKITVSIKSIASSALSDITYKTGMTLAQVSVADQDSAAQSLTALRGMVNYISDIRGELGATQNRLDHTINNLSVMTENIQDVESTIRDTDVAEEMMAYTKNNIPIQSAQAMLAQANMVPQGVLQLLG